LTKCFIVGYKSLQFRQLMAVVPNRICLCASAETGVKWSGQLACPWHFLSFNRLHSPNTGVIPVNAASIA
jgi:hypothetical protein